MNAKIVTAALALSLTSVASFATDLAWRATLDDAAPSTLTRAQVRADLARTQADARFDGTRIAYALPGSNVPAQGSGLTRAQVRAELARARASGELDIGVQAWGTKPAVDAVPAPALAATQREISKN